jgi:hypothetical protein
MNKGFVQPHCPGNPAALYAPSARLAYGRAFVIRTNPAYKFRLSQIKKFVQYSEKNRK